MPRFLLVAVLALVAAAVAVPVAQGSPHFVGQPTITRSGDAITVAGKVAGLGDETQINVAATADVACVNPATTSPRRRTRATPSLRGPSRAERQGAVQRDRGGETSPTALRP